MFRARHSTNALRLSGSQSAISWLAALDAGDGRNHESSPAIAAAQTRIPPVDPSKRSKQRLSGLRRSSLCN